MVKLSLVILSTALLVDTVLPVKPYIANFGS